jgi:hypothetical protein
VLAPSHVAVRLAQDLVDHYGEDAERAAADRLEAMQQLGNADAAGVWAAVSDLIAQIRGRRRPDA